MKCPYCVSEIADEALVCAVCRRDLYVIRPLQARIAELEAQLAAGDANGEDLVAAGQTPAAGEGEVPEMPVAEPPRALPAALLWWALPVLALLLGHALLSFMYDAPAVILRLLALFLPLPFGYLFARAARLGFFAGLLPAFAMAVLAVLAMSGLTALVDGVPVWPQNMQEGREFIEFAASIGFSFTTGLWLYSWQQARAERAREMAALLRRKALTVDGKKLNEKIGRLNDFGSGVVTLLTTAAALYTGLKQILG